jgi:hypothetical protein
MDNINRYPTIVDTLTDPSEENRVGPTQSAATQRSLRSQLTEIGNLPKGSMFLGVAEDGLPVLLNLYDPVPGSLLITADQTGGKTSMLKMIARATEYLHTPAEVQYGVITPNQNDWIQFQNSKTNAGIYSVTDNATGELLRSLVTWAHNNKGEQQSILLLIDELEEMLKLDDPAKQDLRWLLLRGPSRRVWPIVTLRANHAKEMTDWLEIFHTRLFGHIQESPDAETVSGTSNTPLNTLQTGSQFCMRDGDNWLNFWIPTID